MNWNNSYVATLLDSAYADFKQDYPNEEPFWRITCLRRRTKKWVAVDNWRSDKESEEKVNDRWTMIKDYGGQVKEQSIPKVKTIKTTTSQITKHIKVQGKKSEPMVVIDAPIITRTKEIIEIPVAVQGNFSIVRRDQLPYELECVAMDANEVNKTTYNVWPSPNQMIDSKKFKICVDLEGWPKDLGEQELPKDKVILNSTEFEQQLITMEKMKEMEGLRINFKHLNERFEALKDSFKELSNINLSHQLNMAVDILKKDLTIKIDEIRVKEENDVKQGKMGDMDRRKFMDLIDSRKKELLKEKQSIIEDHKILADTQQQLVSEHEKLNMIRKDNRDVIDKINQINSILGKEYSVIEILSKYQDLQKKLNLSKSQLIPKLLEFKDIPYDQIIKDNGYIMSIPLIVEELLNYTHDPDDYLSD
jgi:hypothetical protein